MGGLRLRRRAGRPELRQPVFEASGVEGNIARGALIHPEPMPLHETIDEVMSLLVDLTRVVDARLIGSVVERFNHIAGRC